MNIIPKPNFYCSLQEKDGVQCWKCECSISGFDGFFSGEGDSYEAAQDCAAKKMLDFMFCTTPEPPPARPQKQVTEIDDDSEESKQKDEIDYISAVFRKVNRKEISSPEFSFSADGSDFVCTAKLDGDEFKGIAPTWKEAKQASCQKILQSLEDEYKKYIVN